MKNLEKYMIILVLILILATFGVTYSYFQANIFHDEVKPINVSTGNIQFNISDVNVKIDNIIPIYDSQYESLAYNKEFVVSNLNGTLNGCASIYLNVSNLNDNLKCKYLKYKLIRDDNMIYEGDFTEINENKILLAADIYIKSGEYNIYNLYIWISYDDNENQMNLLNNSFNANISVIGFDSNDGICK